MNFLELLGAFAAFAVTIVVIYLMKGRGVLEKLGVPVVPPFLIFGSPPFFVNRLMFHEHITDQFKKYGKTWATYLGVQPMVVTIDPDLIKNIMVKNFDHFTDVVDWDLPDDKITLDMSGGEKWRALRKALSPTFTSGKLKGMIDQMDGSVENLIKNLEPEAASGNLINMKEKFQMFSLDNLVICTFGIQLNSFENDKNEILDLGRKFLSGFVLSNYLESFVQEILNHFPFLNKYVGIYPEAYDRLFLITKQIMQERRETKGNKPDFIGRLIDLQDDKDSILSSDIITAQGVIFLGAGLETSSHTLTTFSYNMAKHPDIQEKIYDEIRSVLDAHDGKIGFETIGEMPLLEAAINENLRMFSPATDQFRICVEDCEVNGIQFKKGIYVQMPTWPAHYNEEYFPEPEKFIPERFFKENIASVQPFTFRPFGGGNRVCIGQRFALTQIKICLASIMSKFIFEAVPETCLKFEKGSPFFLCFNELKLKLVPRQ